MKKSNEIVMKPIGTIHTPFKDVDDNIPIQGKLMPEHEGKVEVNEEYREGLMDIDGFSHLILIYSFHKSSHVKLVGKPYMDNKKHGVFAYRSPHRPNHIGLTIVELIDIKDNTLIIKGVDMVDGTPLLDIKPYNPGFDEQCNVRTGWMEKYFNGDKKMGNITVDSKEKWLHED
ncbi:tRNA (N6-threonylcarbamoyladenosine(37)-N6)-methyltransferase TrmO [Spirochaetota bacterium]